MLTENQEKWLKALESGEFKQVNGTLQYGDRYCCLGVGCVVAEQNGVVVHRDGVGNLVGGGLGDQEEAMRWLGLRYTLGEAMDRESGLDGLYRYNDTGIPHPKIAEIIRKNPEQYFVQEDE